MANVSPDRAFPLARVPRWDLEADVVIVGFGAAGASAAIEAAANGARVLVLEVASGSGGTSAMAGGDIYLGGNGGTPVQRANGFEDATDDFYRYMLAAGGPDAVAGAQILLRKPRPAKRRPTRRWLRRLP